MRTQYFANVNGGHNLKRLKNGKVEYFSAHVHGKWVPSMYVSVEGWQPYRLTRDQARKHTPAAFR